MSCHSGPMSTSASAHAVRAALLNHDFTADGVLNEIGAEAFAALGRGERVPALHVLAERDDSALIALIRLFLLGEPLPPEAVRRCLPWSHAHGLGLVEEVEQSSGGVLVRPVIQVHPYPCDGRDCFVVSDFPLASAAGRGRRAGGDHVVGVGGASVTLATLAPRVAAARALDLGTGCGVQALNLAGHCRSVVATDRNLRALEMASISAASAVRARNAPDGLMPSETANAATSGSCAAPSSAAEWKATGMPADWSSA